MQNREKVQHTKELLLSRSLQLGRGNKKKMQLITEQLSIKQAHRTPKRVVINKTCIFKIKHPFHDKYSLKKWHWFCHFQFPLRAANCCDYHKDYRNKQVTSNGEMAIETNHSNNRWGKTDLSVAQEKSKNRAKYESAKLWFLKGPEHQDVKTDSMLGRVTW